MRKLYRAVKMGNVWFVRIAGKAQFTTEYGFDTLIEAVDFCTEENKALTEKQMRDALKNEAQGELFQ